MYFESILDKNKISIVRNIDTNSYRIKNRKFYLVKDEVDLIDDGNNLKV
jgi:hypothetical protein